MGKKKYSADDYSVENFVKFAKNNIKGGAMRAMDDANVIAGTKRGKMVEDSLDEKYPYRSKGYSKGGVTMRGYGKARAGNKCKIY
jgi:hypothetical protein